MMIRPVYLALLLLVVAFPVAAQNPEFNVMGITQENFWYNDFCLEGPGAQVYTLSIYLQYPYNDDFDDGSNHMVERIGGFELKLEATGGATILERRFPVPAVDVGSGNSMIVGFGEPVLVDPDHYAILAEVDVLLMPYDDPAPEENRSPVGCSEPDGLLFLSPAYPASIEGMLAYLDADDPSDPMVAAIWTAFPEEYPDFYMQTIGVPTDEKTLDGIKAIYR